MSATRNTSVVINTMDLHLEYFVVQGLTCEHIDTTYQNTCIAAFCFLY